MLNNLRIEHDREFNRWIVYGPGSGFLGSGKTKAAAIGNVLHNVAHTARAAGLDDMSQDIDRLAEHT